MILNGGGVTLLLSFVSPAIYLQKILYLDNGIFGKKKYLRRINTNFVDLVPRHSGDIRQECNHFELMESALLCLTVLSMDCRVTILHLHAEKYMNLNCRFCSLTWIFLHGQI